MQEKENSFTLGAFLKEHRKKQGLTQIELAQKLNTTQATIYKYEQGIIKVIPTPTLEKLCIIFNLSHEDKLMLEHLSFSHFINPFFEHQNEYLNIKKSDYIVIKKSEFTPAQIEQIENFINFIRTQGKDKN